MNLPATTPASNRPGSTIIEPVGAHGGAHFYDISLCRAIRQAGIDATLATSDVTPQPDDVPVRHSYVRVFGRDAAWKRAWRFACGTVDALRWGGRRGHQIAHLHFYGFELLQLLNIGLVKLFGRKLVITAHDVEVFDGSHRVGRLARWAYGSADALIAHNEVTRQALLTQAAIPAARIHVIRHGDHLELVPRIIPVAEARRGLQLDEDAFVVGFFGQIKEVKGLDVLIRAAARAKLKTSRRLHLLIAGRPWRNDFAPYQSLLDELGLAADTTLHIRYVADDELPSFYCAADVMVLPYRKIYQSGVILMAMALKRPVVVSDLPGMTEMIEHRSNGLVFKTDDPQALAEQLLWAEANGSSLAELASRAFERMSKEHAWQVVGAQTASLYDRIAAGT